MGAGRPFVGRERELAELRAALDDAAAGRGALYLLAGEPGIGKSTLVDELTRVADPDTFLVAWGRCWEAGGAPVFWPWIQILRSITRREARAPGGDESVLADLLPDAGRAASSVEDTAPDDARFALFDAVSSYLSNRSAEMPLLLVIEDLHAADVSSSLLLRFLAPIARRNAIVIVGTYRDAEPDVDPRVAATLADIGSEATVIPLRGLSRDEVGRFIDEVAGTATPAELARVVHDATTGNPFFVDGVVRLLASERGLDRVPQGPVTIPARIRDSVLHRVAKLSPEARALLETASVIGRDFDADVLGDLSGRPGSSVTERLTETVRAGLVRETLRRLGRYSFSHALIRDALYDDLSPSRRETLHRDLVGSIRARFADDLESHLDELAHHASAAVGAGLADDAARYAELAGRRAVAALAYEDGEAHLRRALGALDRLPADPGRRARVMLELADACARAGDLPEARATVERAIDHAHVAGDAVLQARATIALGTLELGGLWIRPWVPDPPAIRRFEQALDALGDRDGQLRARLLAQLGAALYFTDERERGADLAREAVAIAETLDDPAALAFCLAALHIAAWTAGNLDERRALATRIVDIARTTGQRELELQGLIWLVTDTLESGDATGARAFAERYASLAEALQRKHFLVYAAIARTTFALMEGRLADAERSNEQARELAAEVGDEGAMASAYVPLMMILRETGRTREISDSIRAWGRAIGDRAQWSVVEVQVDMYDGHLERAMRGKDALVARGLLDRDDCFLLASASQLTEIAYYARDPADAGRFLGVLAPYAGRYMIGGRSAVVPNGPVARFVAMAASLLGRHEEADAAFAAALEQARSMGARLHVARISHEWARALADRGEAHRAAPLIDQARTLATELGCTVLLKELEQIADEPPADHVALSFDGDSWTVAFGDERARVPDRVGMRYLAQLTAEPNREFHALDLLAPPGPRAGSDATQAEAAPGSVHGDPVADDAALRDYRERTAALRREIEDAKVLGDAARAERAEDELDQLLVHLRSLTGLGGRVRRVGSDAERARVSVTKAVKAAIDRIAERAPRLGAHLSASVRTGTWCSYAPERARRA